MQLERDKQYAIRQPNNTFRYFQYVNSRNESGVFFNPCPQPSSEGRLALSDTTTVMRVEDALAQGLQASGQPCDVNQAPFYK